MRTLVVIALLVWSTAARAQQDDRPVWLDVIELGTTEADRLFEQAVRARDEGRATDAVALLRQAADAAPGRLDIRVHLLRDLVATARWDEVLAATEGIADGSDPALAPSVGAQGDPTAVAGALFFRAIALAATGRYDEGAELLERVTRYRADLPDAHVYYTNLAELHAAAGRLDRAAIFYRQALGTHPEYVVARLGLAIVLQKAGQADEARTQALRAVLEDPTLSFLREPGLFFVPQGEVHLYSAFPALVSGNGPTARAALDAYAASEASDIAPAGFVDGLVASIDDASSRVRMVSVPDCTPVRIAVSPDRRRAAVHCEYGGVRDIPLDEEGEVATGVTDPAGYYDYSVIDIAWAPDGQSLRVLHSDGFVETHVRQGTTLVPGQRSYFDQLALVPSRFLPDGERIVFTGASSGGFMVERWDATAVQPQLTYPAVQTWMYSPVMSADGNVVAHSDGASIHVLRGPAWTVATSIELTMGTSRFAPWALSPDGSAIATAQGAILVRTSTATGAPAAAVSVTSVAPSVAMNPYEGISTVAWVDDETLAFGTTGQIGLVRLR